MLAERLKEIKDKAEQNKLDEENKMARFRPIMDKMFNDIIDPEIERIIQVFKHAGINAHRGADVQDVNSIYDEKKTSMSVIYKNYTMQFDIVSVPKSNYFDFRFYFKELNHKNIMGHKFDRNQWMVSPEDVTAERIEQDITEFFNKMES